ncbi:MAG TPA: hypothetical protein VJ997_07560 [Longimicrobiales bacterium]|nr:hypothetical protein [Longimicrobiales bacterium]
MLDWANIAPMLVAIVLFVVVGGVILLKPIANRVGFLLEAMAKEKESGLGSDMGHVRDLLETMNARLQLLEERQDFTERLLSGEKRRDQIGGGS